MRVHIYPDFSATLLEKRREFDPIKKPLRDMEIKYSLQYPAILRVDFQGTTTHYCNVRNGVQYTTLNKQI